MATAAVQSDPPLIVRGQLAIRTIPGRNGRFTVGRLTTRLGLFHVKDPELEQYPEGKYDGEFVIRYIYPKAYPVGDGMRFEIRANLDGMTLSGIDKLSKAEARAFAAQDVDPLDEELGTPPATTPATAEKSKSRSKPEPAPVQASRPQGSRHPGNSNRLNHKLKERWDFPCRSSIFNAGESHAFLRVYAR